jgi:hypothetical protein
MHDALFDPDPDAPDYRNQAQKAAELHLEVLDGLEYLDSDSPAISALQGESTAYGPYCGCQTCVVREILYAAWPYAQLELVGWVETRLRTTNIPQCQDLADELALDAASMLGDDIMHIRTKDEELSSKLENFCE